MKPPQLNTAVRLVSQLALPCAQHDKFRSLHNLAYLLKVNGVDEVQMIVTSADRVLPHIQTVTTYASDFNEVQTIELDGDDVDEVQEVFTVVKDPELDAPEHEVQVGY